MKKQIKIAVIPAAGSGTRISELPLTRILPKPMLPLLNKPIAEHIIDWLKSIGIKKIYFIVSFKKEIFKDYFGDGEDFGVQIKYINCPDRQKIGGLADGLYLLKNIIKKPFIVVLGDDFTITKSYEDLINTFFTKKSLVLETVVKETNINALRRACSVKLDKEARIIDIQEKPENPKWAIRGCGIYIFDPIIFSFIEKTPLDNGKKDITKTIQIMAQETKKVFGFLVEKNININTLDDLYAATLTVLQRK